VVLGLKGPGRLFAERFDDLVVLLSAGDDALRGQVGQLQEERADLLLQRALLLVQRLDAVGHVLELRHQRRGILAALFHAGDFLVQAVALRLDRLVFGDQAAALLVHFEQLAEIDVAAPLGKSGLDALRVGPDQVDVQHLNASFIHVMQLL